MTFDDLFGKTSQSDPPPVRRRFPAPGPYPVLTLPALPVELGALVELERDYPELGIVVRVSVDQHTPEPEVRVEVRATRPGLEGEEARVALLGQRPERIQHVRVALASVDEEVRGEASAGTVRLLRHMLGEQVKLFSSLALRYQSDPSDEAA